MNHGVLIKVSGANQGSVFVLLHGWPIDLPIPYYLLFMAALHMIGKRPIHPSEAPASPAGFKDIPTIRSTFMLFQSQMLDAALSCMATCSITSQQKNYYMSMRGLPCVQAYLPWISPQG